mgnify:CR=1 FL=1
MVLHSKNALARARACLRIETAALTATAKGLGAEFIETARAVEAVSAAGGKLIFSGVGKSAHIAQKIAATFNSTGVASCFIDATQALHGDRGRFGEEERVENVGFPRVLPAFRSLHRGERHRENMLLRFVRWRRLGGVKAE